MIYLLGIAAIAGWATVAWVALKLSRAEDDLAESKETLLYFQDMTRNENKERLKVEGLYESLVASLKTKALTASPVEPQNKRVRAGSWAQIRKANEAAIRNESELTEARERDTAFQE